MDLTSFLALEIHHHTIDLLFRLRVPVETEFVLDIEEDDDTAGNPHGQTQKINKRIPLVSFQIPESRLDIIQKHAHHSFTQMSYIKLYIYKCINTALGLE